MADVSVAILGLRRLGQSVGLALQRNNQGKGKHNFTITGYDTTVSNVRSAQKSNAIHNGVNNPTEAVEGKDIVVLALPYGEVHGAYRLMASALRLGAVILDFSGIAEQALQWATEELPPEAHVVCATPIINPEYLFDNRDAPENASADYFDKGLMLLMPSVKCIKDAISLASDFSHILGATPNFYDTAEHDALMASTQALPLLTGITLFNQLSQSQGWVDTQRLTNPAFGTLTRPLYDIHPDDLREYLLVNRDNIIQAMDTYMQNLHTLRQIIASDDLDTLDEHLQDASANYESWINRRNNNEWQEKQEIPKSGGIMGNMLGGLMPKRGDKNK